MSRFVVVLILLWSCVMPCVVGDQTPEASSENDSQPVAEDPEKKTDEGKHPDKVAAEPVEWHHKLPIFGKKVSEMGFKLPDPYGISVIVVRMEQDVSLSDLRVKLSGDSGPPTPVPFVTIGTSDAASSTGEAKFDFWLFPFLNVFTFFGHIDGEAFVPITVPGEDTLKAVAPPIGALCDQPPGTPLRPALCDQDFIILDNTNYEGTNAGVGIVLAAGFGRWFVALPMSYSESDLSNTTGFINTFQASARFGFSAPLKDDAKFNVYLGTTYLDTAQDITGTVTNGTLSIDYTIHQEAAEPWNYLAGFNWTITRKWWFQAEYGFGGKRTNLISSVNFRW